MAKDREDRRLKKLTEICLGLPEAERALRGDHADFRVRGLSYCLAAPKKLAAALRERMEKEAMS